MCEIAGLAPATIDKTEIEPLSALRHTLAERYAKKESKRTTAQRVILV
jgi:hypothetical protein